MHIIMTNITIKFSVFIKELLVDVSMEPNAGSTPRTGGYKNKNIGPKGVKRIRHKCNRNRRTNDTRTVNQGVKYFSTS
jgi:hypothetical protein